MARFLLAAALLFPQDSVDPVAGAIDAYFAARWKELQVVPASRAGDHEFLRRVTMDVAGRIPKPDEIRAFIAAPDRTALVDRLLASPEAARFAADRWLRLLFNFRFEETDPIKVDFPAFVGWLERAYADDLPYDRFARALIAPRGELVDRPEAGFVLRYLDPKEPPIALANRTTRVFLGLQMQCAQCHDHPSEKISQDEFWGVTAYFGGLQRKTRRTFDDEVKTKLHQELPATVKRVISDVPQPEDISPRFFDGSAPGAAEAPVDVLAAKVVAFPGNRFAVAAVNRMWAALMGRAFIEPVDRITGHDRPDHGPLLETLAADFQKGGYRVRRLLRGILLSKVYGLSSVRTPAPESEHAFKLLKPQDPPQFLNNFVWTLDLDVFFKDFYRKFSENKDLPDSYRNQVVFRVFLTTFVQKLLAPGGRAPEESPYAGSVQLALKLMNSHDLQGLFRAGWGRLAEILKAEPDPSARIERIYLTLLSRPPTGAERDRALAYFKRKSGEATAYEDLYWSLVNSAEFFFNH